MIVLQLLRTENSEDGVFGVLTIGSELTLHTMEDDWKENARRKSCIPAGTYRLRRTMYHKHGYETFEVSGVPDRSRILIHPANTEEDVEGCIGVGLRRGTLTVPDEDTPGHPPKAKRAIVSSRQAFDLFMRIMQGADEADLVITWAPGLP